MPSARNDMVWIPGGSFRMGSDLHYPEEGPAHEVEVSGFWMDACPLTNVQFAAFVEATGHTTFAERAPEFADYPDAPSEALVAGSLVFVPPGDTVDLDDWRRRPSEMETLGPPWGRWWAFVAGADWRHPRGPDSSIARLGDHPVVHVAVDDALAYARWCGKNLPTEAEFEFAARSGLDQAEFAWGDDLAPHGKVLANYWLGAFPHDSRSPHGGSGTSPVHAYPPNRYGAYDLIGNVWEWTADWYSAHATPLSCCGGPHNPRGGSREHSVDLFAPGPSTPRRVIKGGSHLCAPEYCARYRPAARLAQPIDTTTCHVGFRCVVREEGPQWPIAPST